METPEQQGWRFVGTHEARLGRPSDSREPLAPGHAANLSSDSWGLLEDRELLIPPELRKRPESDVEAESVPHG